jgi:CBS-domain-containing membrane protein
MMNVKALMSRPVRTVRPEASLAVAAGMMWEHDCGALPVVDADSRIVGIVTDRDICIAVGTRHRVAADIEVCEVMSRDVQSCGPEDDIRVALATMREQRVRRVPVVDGDRRVVGIVSLDDAITRADEQPGAVIRLEDVIGVLKAVGSYGRASAAAGRSPGAASHRGAS